MANYWQKITKDVPEVVKFLIVIFIPIAYGLIMPNVWADLIQEDTQTEFTGGLFDNVVDNGNGDATPLLELASGYSGTYTSNIFDSATSVNLWNSISWNALGNATGDGEIPLDTTNLIAQWNFNETSGTTANNDAEGTSCGGTPSNCDGTLINFDNTTAQDADHDSGWTYYNRRWGGGALQLDGDNDYVNVPHSTALNLSATASSYSFWAYCQPNRPTDSFAINKYNNGSYNGYSISLKGADCNPYFFYGRSSGSYIRPTFPDLSDKLADKWAYIVYTLDNDTLKLYINGELSFEQTGWTVGVPTTTNTTNALWLGYRNTSSNSNYTGVLDTISLYNRVLSESEIISLYNSSSILFQTRVGADTSPENGGWEDWSPAASEVILNNFNSDSANWLWDVDSTIVPAQLTDESIISMDGGGSLNLDIGEQRDDASASIIFHFDETNGDLTGSDIFDSGINSNNGEINGTNLASSVIKGVYGKARAFNGTNDYISIPDSASVDLGTSDFSVMFWIKPETGGDTSQGIVAKRHNTGGDQQFFLRRGVDNSLGSYVRSTSSAQGVSTPAGTLTENVWNHVAFVADRRGNASWYVNGEFIAAADISANSGTLDNSSIFEVGSANAVITSSITKLKGSLDELLVTKRLLSEQEIIASYRLGRGYSLNKTLSSVDLSAKKIVPFYIASDTPGTYLEASIGETASSTLIPDANTVGLWHFEEDLGSSSYLADSSSNSLNGTPTGTTFVGGMIGKARNLNGTTDHIAIADSDSLSFVGGAPDDPFSISLWAKMDTIAGTGDGNWLVTKRDNAGNDEYQFYFYEGYLYFWCGDAQGDRIAIRTNRKFITNTWYHFASTYDGSGSSSGIHLYVNGILQETTDTSSGVYDGMVNGTAPLIIGKAWVDTLSFDGIIDEVKIQREELSADTIRQEYDISSRSYPITIRFGASLDNSNLIADSSDTSFTIDATTKGLSAKGAQLYVGDKIVIKENYAGTEYIAQGTVSSVDLATGATTTEGWDPGGTFPSSGFTANATVFKWQREYLNISDNLPAHLDSISKLQFRITNGNEGRSIYFDDIVSSSGYLYDSSASVPTSSIGNRYFQYRSIFTTTNSVLTPQLTSVSIDYSTSSFECVWVGSDGDWETTTNWDCNGTNRLPTATDPVRIADNVIVTLNGATMVDALTLGDSGGATTPTLVFNYDAITNGSLTIDDGDFNIYSGATITHTNGTSVVVGTVNIDVQTGDLYMSGNINLQGTGYASSEGPGAGADGNGAGGAGYGGEGGNDGYAEHAGGSIYGSLTAPTDLGSGGGVDGIAAAAGGGAVKLNVGGTLTVNGSIVTDGAINPGYSSYDTGGGSGGSVLITTSILEGGGSISSNGTNGYRYGGAGSGGRIAVHYTTDNSSISYSTHGGALGGSGGHIGAAGTIYLKSAGGNGDVIIDNNNLNSGYKYTYLPIGISLDSLTIKNSGNINAQATYTISTVNIENSGILYNMAGDNLTYTTLNWSTAGIIYDRGGTFDLVSGGGDLVVPATATLYADTARNYTNVTIDGIVTHSANGTTEVYKLSHTVSGNYTINSSGSIDVQSKGYARSEGPGQGNYNPGTGAGYGGEGGNDSYNNNPGGGVYGSLTAPVDLGSGGGVDGTTGASGGGAVKLDIGGIFSNFGYIKADGQPNPGYESVDAGGGSGGSIYIIADTLSGTGTITANGSDGYRYGGAGGGGRIAIYYTTDSSTITYTAYGGTNGGHNGAAGTIYLKSTSDNGQVILKNSDINPYPKYAYLPDSLVIDSIDVSNGGSLKSDTGVTTTDFDLTAGGIFQMETGGVLSYTNYTWTTNSIIYDRGGSFYPISGGDSLIVPLTTYLYADTARSYTDVTIDGTVTHTANGATEVYKINHTVSGNYTISATGSIDVQSQGYAKSEGPGQGNYNPGTGAGHGGEGGNDSYNNNPGGGVYGSLTAPTTLGSGGGIDGTTGASGGGAVKLDVGGTLNHLGVINADGQPNPGYSSVDAGGGSGGSVYIIADTLTGDGSISANGSDGYRYGGAGGGGRIAIYYTTDSSIISYTAYGGAQGGSGGHIGAAGTIYLKPSIGNPRVILDNVGRNSGFKSAYMEDGLVIDTLTISNGGNLSSDKTYFADTININTGGVLFNQSTNNLTYNTFIWGAATTIYDEGGTFDYISGGGNFTVPDTCTFYADTTRSYTGITVNGNITHQYNYTTEVYKINITSTGDLLISSTGSINTDLRGYQSSEGPGAGGDNSTMSGGAGHGGVGGWTLGGPIYDSETVPANIGSGGGQESAGDGGRGGGAITLNVSGALTNNGSLSANGGDWAGVRDSGGGSGGSIYISTSTFEGTGDIYATGGNGGYYDPYDGGGGGGGRIAIYYSVWNWTGSTLTTDIATAGGLGKLGANGGDGTVYLASINQLPAVDSITIDSGAVTVDLTGGATQPVVCSGTVSDADGYLDINSVTAYFFRTGVGIGAADDGNNHYTVSGDSVCIPSNGLGTAEDYNCTIDVYYFAEATDAGSAYEADNWTCTMVPNDGTGDGTSLSDTIEVNSLLALGVSASIDYGILDEGTSSSSNIQAEISNQGNTAIDMDVYGSDLCTDYPVCIGESIGVENQEYSLTPFVYGTGTVLGTASSHVHINLVKPIQYPSDSTIQTYWGLGVPALQKGGVYEGANVFTATADL